MKKLLLVSAAVLLLTGCGANGRTLECVRDLGPDENGIEELSTLSVVEKGNKLVSYKNDWEIRFPEGVPGMGEAMSVVRAQKDAYQNSKAVTYTYSIDGDNIKATHEINFKNISEEDLNVVKADTTLKYQEDAEKFIEGLRESNEAFGATCTLK